MKNEQIKRIKRELRVCTDTTSAFNFCKDLSKYLKENLNENIIKEIQREYVSHFKQNLNKINQYISSQLVHDLSPESESYDESICKKKLVEHSILFFRSNDFIDDSFDNECDNFIFQVIKGSKNTIYEANMPSYNYGYHRILNKFGNIFSHDVEIHKDFSIAMISFLKNNIDNYSNAIKYQLNLILHSLIVYCGDKIDYNRMVFSESLYSEDEKEDLIRIGDILSFDKEYYKNRFNSIERKKGYMDRRERILRYSLDSDILDTELAQLAGKLSKNNAYNFSIHFVEKRDSNKGKFSAYARTLIMSSKHYPVYHLLYDKISKEDFIMCLPIFSECFSNSYYFAKNCRELLEKYQK